MKLSQTSQEARKLAGWDARRLKVQGTRKKEGEDKKQI